MTALDLRYKRNGDRMKMKRFIKCMLLLNCGHLTDRLLLAEG